eukprot:1159733-Pelagomonas_calceolata.AAC.2
MESSMNGMYVLACRARIYRALMDIPGMVAKNIAETVVRALMDIPGMDAKTIAEKAMRIAAESCVYTNANFMVEVIGAPKEPETPSVLGAGADLNPISKAEP